MSARPPVVDIDQVIMTENGVVVFVSVRWPDQTTQRASLSFEQPLASRFGSARVAPKETPS